MNYIPEPVEISSWIIHELPMNLLLDTHEVMNLIHEIRFMNIHELGVVHDQNYGGCKFMNLHEHSRICKFMKLHEHSRIFTIAAFAYSLFLSVITAFRMSASQLDMFTREIESQFYF